MQSPPVGEDCSPADPIISNNLYKLSEMEFRVELLRMFNKLKETMIYTAILKESEDINAEMRKIQTEISKLKSLVGNIKNELKSLIREITTL